jgi:hypothetical protein
MLADLITILTEVFVLFHILTDSPIMIFLSYSLTLLVDCNQDFVLGIHVEVGACPLSMAILILDVKPWCGTIF